MRSIGIAITLIAISNAMTSIIVEKDRCKTSLTSTKSFNCASITHEQFQSCTWFGSECEELAYANGVRVEDLIEIIPKSTLSNDASLLGVKAKQLDIDSLKAIFEDFVKELSPAESSNVFLFSQAAINQMYAWILTIVSADEAKLVAQYKSQLDFYLNSFPAVARNDCIEFLAHAATLFGSDTQNILLIRTFGAQLTKDQRENPVTFARSVIAVIENPNSPYYVPVQEGIKQYNVQVRKYNERNGAHSMSLSTSAAVAMVLASAAYAFLI